MTTRTPPRHGERRCYLRGCRRPECAAANYRYMSRYRLDRHRTGNRRLPADATAHHIQQLTAAGWSYNQIAAAAGPAHRTISAIAQRRTTTVTPDTERRILNIPIQPPAATQYVDATGTRRRLQALVAIGWPFVLIGPAIGLHATATGRIARGDLPQVRHATAQAVAAVYRDWSRRPGPNQRARLHATRLGWHGPAVWDTGTIDNPAAEPETDEPDLPGTPRYVAIAEDGLELVERQGYSRREAAVRLGVTKNYLEASIRRYRSSAYGEAA